MTSSAPIVFQHQFKSGGTSVISRMRAMVGEDRLLHVKSVPSLLEMAREDPEKLRGYTVIAGHIPMPAIKRLFPEAALMTILRDPVDRIVSQYFHFRRDGLKLLRSDATPDTVSKGHVFRSRFCAENDFEAYILDQSPEITTYTHNYATRMLAGARAAKPPRPGLLHRARTNLEQFALVLTTADIDTRFDETFKALADRQGIACRSPRIALGSGRRRNVSELRSAEDLRLSDKTLKTLVNRNALDYALYADARWLNAR